MNEKRFESAIKIILEEIGEDIDREGIIATPARVCRLYKNLFYGYKKKIVLMDEMTRKDNIDKNIIPITIFKSEHQDMLIRSVKFTSFCEHHVVPFLGEAWVGIIPNKKLLGMNKIDKIVKYFSAKLQIQERLTSEIVDWIDKNVEPLGVIIMIKATHQCAELQGDSGEFITTSVKGFFDSNKDNCKGEFLEAIKLL